MFVTACRMAAGARYQLACLARVAMRAERGCIPEYKLFEYFFTIGALIFIDRHKIFSPGKMMARYKRASQRRSAFRRDIAVQARQDGHDIFEQKMIHKRAYEVPGADVDFLNKRSGRVRNAQNNVA